MDPVAQIVLPDAALVAAAALLVCAGIVVTTLLLRSRSRRRAAMLDEALSRSREQVESLSRKVDELSQEVDRARRESDRDREYVITSLGGADGTGTRDGAAALDIAFKSPAAKVVEERLVGALARQAHGSSASPVRVGAISLVVRTIAFGHGLRRALSPDVLDRAVAEAHVARRRSRRDRRREVRQARRLVRTVDAQVETQVDAQGRDVA